MVSIEEALGIINSQQVETSSIEIALEEALGFYLAMQIIAPFDIPSFDNSAMDGYALCGIEIAYKIVGEVAAGDTSQHELKHGEAMRIFTGGKIPENTTSVIMQEKTEVKETTLYIDEAVMVGKNIRLRGSELSKGQEVFHAGHEITPATIGLLASIGKNSVKVYQKPKVAIITTGNELIPPGEKLHEGQIYESNSYALTAALRRHGFSCQEKKQIPDNFEATKAGIASTLEKADILILSGGISVGDYDFVKQALVENGVKELFYKVFQKPGKPIFFGRKENKFVFALPGNPASSLTCFYIYVLPLLHKLSGASNTGLLKLKVPIAHDYKMNSDRPVFLKALVANEKVNILDGQSSSMIHSLAMGNALAFLTGPQTFRKNDVVDCFLI